MDAPVPETAPETAPEVRPPVREMVQILVGCKWSLDIFSTILAGTRRPGAIVRAHPGLSAKVLNSCLRRHLAYGILNKRSYPEVPPRVEYEITAFGRRFIAILTSIDVLEAELDAPS